MAAVRVVLPWSMWPIVPTLQCGFVRAVFAVADVCAAEASNRHCAVPKLAENWLKLLIRKRKHEFLLTAFVEMMLQLRNTLNRLNNEDIFE